jgi:hypothetical protein
MTEKRRAGRPKTRADEAPGEYVGFRAPRSLKQQLAAAAVAAGRSLSTEAQARLERSFSQENLLEQLFGSREAFQEAILFALNYRRGGERAASGKGLPPETWQSDGDCFVAALISLVLSVWPQHPDPEAADFDMVADLLKARVRSRKLPSFIPPGEAEK